MTKQMRIPSGIWGWKETVFVLFVVPVPLLAALQMNPESRSLAVAATMVGLVIYPTALLSALMLYFRWRLTGRHHSAWLAAVLTAGSVHGLSLAGLMAAYRTEIESHAAGLMVIDLLFAAVSLWMLTVLARKLPPFDPAVLGIAIGLVVTGLILAWAGQSVVIEAPPTVFAAGNLVLLLLHLATAAAILHLSRIPFWARTRLALAVAILAAHRALSYPSLEHEAILAAAALVTAVTGAALLCATSLALLRLSIRDSHQEVDQLHGRVEKFEAAVREDRERLHEINATIAGIASATRLIHGGDEVSSHRKGRLQAMVDSEIARLERLMRNRKSELRVVHLDDVIRPLVVSQQALGRRVAWTPSGYAAMGRSDDVAEAVNILLNNAAKHAPGATVNITVRRFSDTVEIRVSDSGPGVNQEMATRLFDWGARSSQSTGEGIGLHVARRLMTEQGGSLRMLNTPSTGTLFVLDLKTARQAHDAVVAGAQ